MIGVNIQRRLERIRTLILIALLAIVGATPMLAQTSGTWTTTGSLHTARRGNAATLLSSGQVLVSGGANPFNGSELASAELFEPSTGSWVLTGSMSITRVGHALTSLPNGQALAAGGETTTNSNGNCVASAELFEPSLGKWVGTGSLHTARCGPTATLLQNGDVLVAGGGDDNGACVASAELYNPATGKFTVTGSLKNACASDTATLLQNGKVLFAGGTNGACLSSAQLYDPATGAFSTTGSMITARCQGFTATLLNNGEVLVAGGIGVTAPKISAAELYNPATGKWTATGSLPLTQNGAGLDFFTATLLGNGKVLLAGGRIDTNDATTANAELYDPASGTWSFTGSLKTGRSNHTAFRLQNGKVLVFGGLKGAVHIFTDLASAELYTP